MELTIVARSLYDAIYDSSINLGDPVRPWAAGRTRFYFLVLVNVPLLVAPEVVLSHAQHMHLRSGNEKKN